MSPAADYPTGLIGGGPLLQAFQAIQARLREAFPSPKFTHQVVPPKMSATLWAKLTAAMPMVALGWAGWNPGSSQRNAYSGDATFVLFLGTRNARLDWLLTGDRTMPGVFAMAAMAAAYLHGWLVPAVQEGQSPLGSCRVKAITGTEVAEWVNDDVALIGVEIVVPDVTLADPVMQAQLGDFLELGAAWQFGAPTAEQIDDTINVRGSGT